MNCICCNNRTIETEYRDQFYDKRLRYCKLCGHLQLNTLPSLEMIRDYYIKTYSDRRKSFVTSKYLEIMHKRASSQFNYIRHILNDCFSCVSDIGCGYGMLVNIFQQSGFNAIGFEYDPQAIEYCHNKNLAVFRIETENELASMATVDVITLSHVLEHLVNYNETLSVIKNKAKYLFIEVPVYDVTNASQFDDLEGHVNFFTIESLQRFMSSRGFKLLNITRCGPDISLFYSTKMYKRMLCSLRQAVSRDYFMNCYDTVNTDGLWLRAMFQT